MRILFFIFSILLIPVLSSTSSAQTPSCDPDGNGTIELKPEFYEYPGCLATPDTYEITVTEVALCVSAPDISLQPGDQATSLPDISNCEVVFSNPAGSKTTVSGTTGNPLSGGTSSIPLPGTYNSAYLRLKPIASMSGSWNFSIGFHNVRLIEGDIFFPYGGTKCWTVDKTVSFFDIDEKYWEERTIECGETVGTIGTVTIRTDSTSPGGFTNFGATGTGIYVFLIDPIGLPASSPGAVDEILYFVPLTSKTITTETQGLELQVNNSLGALIKVENDPNIVPPDTPTIKYTGPAPFYLKIEPY